MVRALPPRRYLRHGTLPQLLALEAVLRLGSVTRAAEALHLAQPTVSGHLRKLSDCIGQPLYRAGPDGLVATPAGSALLAATHEIFDALQRADARLADLPPPSAEHAAAGPALRSSPQAKTPPIAGTLAVLNDRQPPRNPAWT